MQMTTNVLIFLLVATLGACSKETPGEGEAAGANPAQGQAQGGQAEAPGEAPPQAGTAGAAGAAGAAKDESPAMAEAKQIFGIRCATCHGQAGRGDGPVATRLNPRPRDYSDKEWQASVTDEQIKKVIVEGGPAVGKSVLMAPSPDLGQKPEVLDAMVALIRSFAEQ